MGRARRNLQPIAATAHFAAVLGTRQGVRAPTSEQVTAAAETLLRLGDFPSGYWPQAEAIAVLNAGDISRADTALRELTGINEDYSDFAAAAISAAAALAPVDNVEPVRTRAPSPVPGSKRPDFFVDVLGSGRGSGNTRLDGAAVSAVATANLVAALRRAGAGDLEPVCAILNAHRRSLSTPRVAKLLTDVVATACSREYSNREHWLQEFIHATVRDGREGRVLRQQTVVGGGGRKSEFVLHLRPTAGVDEPAWSFPGPGEPTTPPFCSEAQEDGTKLKTVTAAVAFIRDHESLQRAPVGAWQGQSNEDCIYHHCPVCATTAAKVNETSSVAAGALPAENLSELIREHERAVTAKLKHALSRREIAGTDLAGFATKTFSAAAVGAAAEYAVSGGDSRLNELCNGFLASSAGTRARENGYTGELVDLLGRDYFVAALSARTPRKTPRHSPSLFPHKPRSAASSFISRRDLFRQSNLEEITHRSRRIKKGKLMPDERLDRPRPRSR